MKRLFYALPCRALFWFRGRQYMKTGNASALRIDSQPESVVFGESQTVEVIG